MRKVTPKRVLTDFVIPPGRAGSGGGGGEEGRGAGKGGRRGAKGMEREGGKGELVVAARTARQPGGVGGNTFVVGTTAGKSSGACSGDSST